jgi:hypothetical protein
VGAGGGGRRTEGGDGGGGGHGGAGGTQRNQHTYCSPGSIYRNNDPCNGIRVPVADLIRIIIHTGHAQQAAAAATTATPGRACGCARDEPQPRQAPGEGRARRGLRPRAQQTAPQGGAAHPRVASRLTFIYSPPLCAASAFFLTRIRGVHRTLQSSAHLAVASACTLR